MTQRTGANSTSPAPVTGAPAPVTGAQGTVQGYKTKKKKRQEKENYILLPKQRRRLARKLAAILETWDGPRQFLHAAHTILYLAVQDRLVRKAPSRGRPALKAPSRGRFRRKP